MVMAWIAAHEGAVHGGFVRDWIVRGEVANDLDIRGPYTIVNILENFAPSFELSTRILCESRWKRCEQNITVTSRDEDEHPKAAEEESLTSSQHEQEPFFVRMLVWVTRHRHQSFHVDWFRIPDGRSDSVSYDVCNLAISTADGLHFRCEATEFDMTEVLDNVLHKKARMWQPDQAKRAKLKMLRRGWTILSREGTRLVWRIDEPDEWGEVSSWTSTNTDQESSVVTCHFTASVLRLLRAFCSFSE